MDASDRHYSTLSGFFVEQVPGDVPGSVRVVIHQPNDVRAAVYANLKATGTPTAYRFTLKKQLLLYNPTENDYTMEDHASGYPHSMTSSQLPLGIPQPPAGGVEFSSIGTAGAPVLLADLFIHPAAFLATPRWESRVVHLAGEATIDGRRAYVLYGKAGRYVHLHDTKGNAWRLWVDVRTGLMLKLVYLNGQTPIGQAELRDVRIDGVGPVSAPTNSLAHWSMPANAQYEDSLGFVQYRQSDASGPIGWIRDHSDIALLLAALIILIVLHYLAGKLPVDKDQSPSETAMEASN